jgi:hypothetical protein
VDSLAVLSELAKTVDRRLRWARRPTPGQEALADLFGAMFFASLQTDEHEPVRFAASYVDPDNDDPRRPPFPVAYDRRITRLADPVPVTVASLRKLSRAADPFSVKLAIYASPEGKFSTWGLIDQRQHEMLFESHESERGPREVGYFSAEVTGTGELRILAEHNLIATLRGGELLTKYADVLSWSSDPTRKYARYAHYHVAAVRSVIGTRSWKRAVRESRDWPQWLQGGWFRTVQRLILAVQRYRHGGTLLICPGPRPDDVKASFVARYRRIPTALIGLDAFRVLERLEGVKRLQPDWDNVFDRTRGIEAEVVQRRAEMDGAIRFVASLSRVDGAVLLDGDLSVAGFGVEILTKDEPAGVFRTKDTGAKGRHEVPTAQLGTRHRSVIRFCSAHPEAVGIVVSQDGDVRVITRVGADVVIWENPRLTLQ